MATKTFSGRADEAKLARADALTQRVFGLSFGQYCATVLLDQLKRNPVKREALEQVISDVLDRHICRCTGYVRYFEAVRDLALKTPGLVKA